jgi:hypothetical protein
MKKFCIIITLAILSFVSLNFISSFLVENQTWEQNLTSSDVHDAIAFGDIDNDDDLDMIQTGCGNGDLLSCSIAGKTRIYINNETTLVENQTWQQNLTTTNVGAIALGDIDNDGDLDLILTSTFLKIYTNNGTTFTENQTWQQEVTTESNSGSVNLGDIDNDGDLDLVMMDMDPDVGNTTFLNNGTTFIGNREWGQYAIDDARFSSVLIDIDNDGDLDSVATAYESGPVYINNGTTLKLSSTWYSAARDHASIAVGDVNNDANMDIFIMGLAGACATADVFLENNGSALLSNSTYEDSLIALFFGSAAFGDYDNNGYLDLVINGQCGGTPYIFVYNKTSSDFTWDYSLDEFLSPSQSGSVAWVDLDNDNNLDLINIRSQEIYINNITPSNTLPNPPTTFSNFYTNREINIGWNNGSDGETPALGLYYNLKLGTMENNHSIISGIYGGQGDVSGGGGTAFGYFGNMMQRKNLTLKVDRLEPSTTYYWYVQTIDTGLKAGNWSEVQSFTTPADMERPNITLNSPADLNLSNSYNVVFNATVFDNINLTNVSIWGNWTGTWQLDSTNNSMINNSAYNFSKNLTSYGNGYYMWMIQAEDNQSNVQNSSVRTFTIDTINPSLNITNPTNNTNSSNTGLDITYFVSDTNLDECWYSNDTYSINTTLSGCANITTMVWSEGIHNLTIWANDTSGNINKSYILFTIDNSYPIVNLTTPTNASTWSSSSEVTFTYNVSDVNIINCSLIINGVIDQTDTTISENTTQTFTKTMGNADYSWSINCSDSVNYTNKSITRNLTVSYTAPVEEENGGGGGGGGGTKKNVTSTNGTSEIPPIKEFDIDFSQEEIGYIEVKQGDIKTFTFNNQTKHSITVITLSNNSMTLLITSNPITLQIGLGETKQIDMNEDEIKDLEMVFNSIKRNVANLSLTRLIGADIAGEEELEKEALFDVKINIASKFDVVKSGRTVIAEIEAFNVNNIGQVDIIVEYYITSKEDNITRLSEGSDTLAVEAVTSFVRSLNVPYNLKSGTYLFNVNIKYNDKIMTSGSAEFKVIKSYWIIVVLGIILLIVFGIFFYLWKIKRKEDKLEKKERKIEDILKKIKLGGGKWRKLK